MFLALLLLLFTGSNNAIQVDEDFEKAVAMCAMMIFQQALKDGSVDPMQHGQNYDEAREKCERAIGSLMEH